MDFAHTLGLNKAPESPEEERAKLQLYINLKLASSGQPTCVPEGSSRFFGISRDLLYSYREKNRLLANYHCRVDQRIQGFIKRYVEDLDIESIPTLPTQTFILDRVDDTGPSSGRYRLESNELLRLFAGLTVRYFREDGLVGDTARGLRNVAQLIAQVPTDGTA